MAVFSYSNGARNQADLRHVFIVMDTDFKLTCLHTYCFGHVTIMGGKGRDREGRNGAAKLGWNRTKCCEAVASSVDATQSSSAGTLPEKLKTIAVAFIAYARE